ncbi:hypothetical protein IC757_03210 [Wenzhouxiangella sp. AB-CW3]|uniref:DUF3137 domain-containing protein n=1 Tax=Wenzhouxiangella sp. AB-CW3 TaxID=2771012 RepID=UPI00168A6134|nr:DUF3137 domain-containing protein [Wenzhouxiangella sp. AB-CW3]QOC23180.1 hypothetical protein IC757_03210 [Wenzhouxiangella sp. AB-CW3]
MTDRKTPDRIESDQLLERLQPKLDELEKERQETRQSLLKLFAVIGAVTLVAVIAAAVALALVTEASGALIGLFPLMIGALVMFKFADGRQKRWRARVAEALVPEICEQFDGEMEYRADASTDFVKPYTTLGLVGRWTRGEVQHLLHGEYRGRRFEMVHADLRSGGNDNNDSKVFKGFLLRIQTQASFEPGLYIRPNFGLFAKAFGKRAVPTGNKGFDDRFLVSTDDGQALDSDQLNALFTPDWQQALLAIDETMGPMPITNHSRLSAGLKYDAFYMTLDRSEVGRLRNLRERSFPDVNHLLSSESALEESLRKMVDDVLVCPRVIDQLPEVRAAS